MCVVPCRCGLGDVRVEGDIDTHWISLLFAGEVLLVCEWGGRWTVAGLSVVVIEFVWLRHGFAKEIVKPVSHTRVLAGVVVVAVVVGHRDLGLRGW